MDFSDLLNYLNLNITDVMGRFSGNENLLKRFIAKFPNDNTFNELTNAYNENRLDDAERAVHTLKGIAANLGFEKLCANCTVLLTDLRHERNNLPAEMEAVSLEYNHLVQYIEDYLNQSN